MRGCAALTVAGFLLVPLAPAQAASRDLAGNATAFYLEYVSIPQNSTMVYQTTALTAGADPVLHLLRDNGAGGWTQVAYNDDYGGLNSRVVYTNPGATTSFLLVLRAYSTYSSGTCNLLKQGILRQSGAPVGGTITGASAFIFGTGDELRTVHFPGGSEAPAVIKFSSQYIMTELGLANGVAGASRVTMQGATQFLIGTPQVRDANGYHTLRPGLTIAMANDFQVDSDGDGVGDQLESALGTCPSLQSCGYSATYNSADTDRDGLSDGEELWGVAGTLPSGVDDLPLARWGANPRKKDMFVEVDWSTMAGGAVPTGTSPFQWIRDHPTQPIGGYKPGTNNPIGWKGTLEAWVETIRVPYSEGPAAEVRNPEGSDGIDVHLDLGVAPLSVGDEWKFGAWSTGSAHAMVPDFVLHITQPLSGDVFMWINQTPFTFDATGLSPQTTVLLLAYFVAGSGEPVVVKSYAPDSAGGATLVIGSSVAGLHFARGFLALPVGGYQILPESDGSMQAQYNNDPAQFDENRQGRLRYSIVTGVGGAGTPMAPQS